MPIPALRVEGVSKRYVLSESVQSYVTMREAMLDWVTRLVRPARHADAPASTRTFWALRDVSFEVQPGDVVGVVGRNGAGKSTLLKILSRISEPSEGAVDICGRLGSLLEVGTGFHPELSGRENIYFNGAVLGMKKREIDRRFDEIVEFAEVGPFLDTPVKRYSSGMTMRLAFAVAAHLDPEIMIIDEVLAVGDSAFQKKCLGKMKDKATSGRTILFVSHNLSAVQALCTRCIFLEHGKLVAAGETHDIIERYLSSLQAQQHIDLGQRENRRGSQAIRFERLTFQRDDGTTATTFLSGESVNICLEYSIQKPFALDAVVRVACLVTDLYDGPLFICDNELTDQSHRGWVRNGTICCRIPRLPLPSGNYRLTVVAEINHELADMVEAAGNFFVENGDYYETGRILPGYVQGYRFLVPHSWDFRKAA